MSEENKSDIEPRKMTPEELAKKGTLTVHGDEKESVIAALNGQFLPPKLPFVWELDTAGIVSHAIGTFHITDTDYSEAIESYLKGKNHCLVEMNLFDSELRKELISLIPTLPKIKDYAPEVPLPQQERIARSVHKPYQELMNTTLIEFSSLATDIPGVALPVQKGIDILLMSASMSHGAAIVSLETVAEQMNAFKRILDENARKIPLFLANPETYVAAVVGDFKNRTAAYASGDILRVRQLKDMSGQTLDQITESHPEITGERNRRMTDLSLPYLQQPSIVAVGVAHFLCEPTMLTMYEEKGIKVKRVQ